jgi:MFS family permease
MKSPLSKTVWMLSLVSLFTDMASEMLYPVMPLYLKQIGFTIVIIGVLEGVAEAVAGLSKSYFGGLSDRSGKRLPFVQAGYTLSAISKPMMALFTSIAWIFSARTIDRLGKGLRTGARDAMLSSEASNESKATVFGFHRALDTFGAVIGPAMALGWLYFNPGAYKLLFLFAFLPGLVAILLTLLIKEKSSRKTPGEGVNSTDPGVEENPAQGFASAKVKKNITLLEGFMYWKKADPEYRSVAGAMLLFAMFNSSDVLLFLKMKESGHSDSAIIGVYIFYNLVYALLAYPLGKLADRVGLKKVFMAGLVFFSITYAGFAVYDSVVSYLVLFICYGAYAACTEGISKAWLTNIVGKHETATAIGTFTGFQSIAALIASSLAGLVWYYAGPAAAFLSSSLVGIVVIIMLRRSAANTVQE